jgi:nitrogen fixation protein NifU and related proteins
MNELMNNPEVLRQIIMEHYQYPLNHGLSDDPRYQMIHMSSASCIDDIKVQILVENQIIVDARFDGVACTISTASTSIMTELLKNQPVTQALRIIDEYQKMIKQEPFDADLLQEAYAFHTVGKQANRIKCATIGINGFETLIKEHHHE